MLMLFRSSWRNKKGRCSLPGSNPQCLFMRLRQPVLWTLGRSLPRLPPVCNSGSPWHRWWCGSTSEIRWSQPLLLKPILIPSLRRTWRQCRRLWKSSLGAESLSSLLRVSGFPPNHDGKTGKHPSPPEGKARIKTAGSDLWSLGEPNNRQRA